MLVYILLLEVFTIESFLIKLTCPKKYRKCNNFLTSLSYTVLQNARHQKIRFWSKCFKTTLIDEINTYFLEFFKNLNLCPFYEQLKLWAPRVKNLNKIKARNFIMVKCLNYVVLWWKEEINKNFGSLQKFMGF